MRRSWVGLGWLSAAPLWVVVDRIEGERAVLEWSDGSLGEVPIKVLPPGTREGDRLVPQFIGADASSSPPAPTQRPGARLRRFFHPAPNE